MRRVICEGDGLFPSPSEIKFSCTCPDWAEMCKHVAAALYGVGARLDEEPRLLFVLRGVNESDLVADVSGSLSLPDTRSAAVILEGDVAALFGLEIDDAPDANPPLVAAGDAKIVGKTGPEVGRQRSVTRKRLRRRASTMQPRASHE